MPYKVQILTDKNSWLFKNQNKIPNKYKKYLKNNLLINHLQIKKNYDITLIISYYKIIPKKFLSYSKHNLVIHESDLPNGRGMSPLYWQILKGKRKITFTLFECSKNMDDGKYYFKKNFYFGPTLVYEEIKERQLKCAFELIDLFLKRYAKNKYIKDYSQKGKVTYFPKIQTSFSELNINKTIKSQIDKLRTRDNKNFPAYFFYKKRKYIIKLN
jgi:methionyl-tRNA formyltransferase|tara:strand:+ start:30 stop:671 length:642 start_codon:yes stop_codon:yes gene_type:complete